MRQFHLACFILIGLLHLSPGGAQSETTTPGGDPQSVVSVVILGNSTLEADALVWDQYPLEVADLPSFDVASTLNDGSGRAGASSTPAPTPEPEDGGLATHYIILIVIAGVLVVAAIAGLIWYGVNNKAKAADYARLHPPAEPEPTAGRRAFPPPHPSSKVIQIPLVHLHYVPEAC